MVGCSSADQPDATQTAEETQTAEDAVLERLNRGATQIAQGTPADVVFTAVASELGGEPSPTGTPSPDELAEIDHDPNLPGVFHQTQGRGHFPGGLAGHEMTPFCDGVLRSSGADSVSSRTPAAAVPSVIPTDCYNSNPPSSGEHLGVQRNVDIGDGIVINIPPDPDVYPPEVEIPRDAIPHILEHAGVFVGYHCADGDTACEDVVQLVADIVNDRIDNHDNRVVMARDTDLPVGELGLAAWTRVLNLKYEDYDEDAIVDFIATHSCRFDPEGFC
jgi:hypothetical protein